MHGAHDRNVQLRQRAHQQGLALGDEQAPRHRCLRHLLHITAGAEPCTFATQQDHANFRVIPRLGNRPEQLLRRGEVQRVANFVAGENEFSDRGGGGHLCQGFSNAITAEDAEDAEEEQMKGDEIRVKCRVKSC